MNLERTAPNTSTDRYRDQFLEELSDAVHRRILAAYRGDAPVESMESELVRIVKEVLDREDQERGDSGVSRIQPTSDD